MSDLTIEEAERRVRAGFRPPVKQMSVDALTFLVQRAKDAQRYREALERMTHESCGTNRVPQSVRWARQVLGWHYDKGCAESVEAVTRSHTALSPSETP